MYILDDLVRNTDLTMIANTTMIIIAKLLQQPEIQLRSEPTALRATPPPVLGPARERSPQVGGEGVACGHEEERVEL